MEPGLFEIRDEKDYPVLYTAITEDVDILITSAKDFSEIGVGLPDILTPAEFIGQYVQEYSLSPFEPAVFSAAGSLFLVVVRLMAHGDALLLKLSAAV